jgi:hypothetical protein
MRIDIHCHAIGKGTDITKIDSEVYFNAEDNQHWFTRILYNVLEDDLLAMSGDSDHSGMITTEEYFNLLHRLLISSEEIDCVVLLALDAVYKDDAIDVKKTDLYVSNKFLANKVTALNNLLQNEKELKKRNKKFYLGASVNPNNPKAMRELEDVISNPDAVLIKWIPSAQHIDVRDVKNDFYRLLSAHNMPLLCHVGPEYSFPEGIRNKDKDDFRHLGKPLDLGVKVIAAHCAAPVFPLIDPNVMADLHRMMEEYNTDDNVRLWADTSALSLSTRLPVISEIIDTFPAKWLVHGTDFPIPIDSWPHLPLVTRDITPKEYIAILKTKNPFDRDVKIKRAHGFSDIILENAKKVLRLPSIPIP